MVKQIILVGAGAMGAALAQGWKGEGGYNVLIVDPHANVNQDNIYQSLEELMANQNASAANQFKPDFVVFAVKPQIIDTVLPLYKIFQQDHCVFVSIAAGVSLETLKKHLGQAALCVRVMPNLGATVRCSVSGLYTADNLTHDQREHVFHLFQCVGMAFWVDSQEQIDAVTSVSGSGPAYIFRFIESLVNAARRKGFDETIANQMVLQTVLGAIKLLEQGGTPEAWCQRVTSPGGTTAAALAVFDRHSIDNMVDEAVEAAYRRAKELS